MAMASPVGDPKCVLSLEHETQQGLRWRPQQPRPLTDYHTQNPAADLDQDTLQGT